MKIILILIATISLGGCELTHTYEKARANRIKYAKDIRETVNECLSSVRSNPSYQNFNDDNEIVETCTEYAMKLYNANWDD